MPCLEKYRICGPLYTALCTIALFLTSSSLAKTRSKFLKFTISANYNIEHSSWYNMRCSKQSHNFNQLDKGISNSTSWAKPVCAASRSISSCVILFSSPSFFLFIGCSKTKYLSISIAQLYTFKLINLRTKKEKSYRATFMMKEQTSHQ